MFRSFLLLSLGVLAGCSSLVSRPSPPPTIQFLLVNDVYIGEPMENGLGGIARLTTLRRQLAEKAPVKLVLAGDFLFPSLLSKWYKGSQVIEYFNVAGLDYATYGNHEFDDSRQTLADRISQSRFKWTSANCMEASGKALPGVSAWDTVTISGVRFGLFGVTLLQAYPRWIKCGNPDSAAHATIPKLKAAGAEIIIGLTHVFRSQDSTFLANEPDIDFILGGHEHTEQIVQIGGRFVVKADRNAQTAQLITLTQQNGGWSRTHRLIRLDSSIGSDPAAASVVARWQDSLEKRLGPPIVLASTMADIDITNEPLRSRETRFGDFVADAMCAGTDAQVAATIGGSMRYDDEIPAGPITNWQVESIYLFPDETRILTFPITGARLRQVLEHSVSRGSAQFGGYLQVSGVEFDWDSTQPAGSRIAGNLRKPDGSSIGPADTIRFSINAYTACDGGDGYSIPESAEACKSREAGPRAADLVMNYMRAKKTVVLPPLGRVKQIR